MERASGFTHNDDVPAKLDKLDALLAKSLTPLQEAARLADMLSLPNDGRYPTLELDPQRRRHKTLEALTAQLKALAQAKPVLMIFEDVHWIDPTSLEALGRTVDRLPYKRPPRLPRPRASWSFKMKVICGARTRAGHPCKSGRRFAAVAAPIMAENPPVRGQREVGSAARASRSDRRHG
jgi:predicted ATPase